MVVLFVYVEGGEGQRVVEEIISERRREVFICLYLYVVVQLGIFFIQYIMLGLLSLDVLYFCIWRSDIDVVKYVICLSFAFLDKD